jgi:hypothetical protein
MSALTARPRDKSPEPATVLFGALLAIISICVLGIVALV